MDWLADPENQKTLALIGSVLVAVATAAWAVFKYFHGSRRETPPSQTITADRGGIAAGRDAHLTQKHTQRRTRK